MTSPELERMAERAKNPLAAFPENRLADFFEFLDELRESGITNMYGAPPYLQKTYPMKRDQAVSVTSAWMKTFSRGSSPIERARTALAKAEAR